MTAVRFYHLTNTPLEQALPRLLEKTLEAGWRGVVLAGSPERVESLTQHLWTWRGESFLPHGNVRDGNAELQPIWLTCNDERPNGAEVLFLTDGMNSNLMSEYDRVCDLFDGNNEEAVTAARLRWKQARAVGFEMSYWQQDAGTWIRADQG